MKRSPSIAATLALLLLAQSVHAAVYLTTADKDAAPGAAQPFIAINGGPAVTIETYDKLTGAVIDDVSGHLETAPWDAPGTASRVIGPAHSLTPYCQIGDTAATRTIPVSASSMGVRILTGANYKTSRGQVIEVESVSIPAGATGDPTGSPGRYYDNAALHLAVPVSGVGTFHTRLTPVPELASIVTVGNGYRLTSEEARNGTYSLPDGGFGFFRALRSLDAPYSGSEYRGEPDWVDGILNDFTIYGSRWPSLDSPPLNGVSAGGNSGSGSILESTIAWNADGTIQSAEYVGTNIGWAGNREYENAWSVYTASYTPIAVSFAAHINTVPEPSGVVLVGLAGALLIRRGPRSGRPRTPSVRT